ncbi:tetratricopeptide repeat protein [Azohydromonas aeria]|uniref:tetratricopeptide repeat protein n=1 Tax=Azohydromonas aeria TaxID=2590212 RepID=UPI0012F94FAF|nr:tetratricopeptide repeat protein [Azohydromonas aeria]
MTPLLAFWLAAGALAVAVTLLVLRPAAAAAAGPGRPWWPRALAAALLPLAAVLSYARLGAPGAIGRDEPPPHRLQEADMAGMVQGLQARLRAQPQDLPGWFTLAHSLEVLERWSEAADAWREALRLAPDDSDLLANAADAVATAQGGQLDRNVNLLIRSAIDGRVAFNTCAVVMPRVCRAGRYTEAVRPNAAVVVAALRRH